MADQVHHWNSLAEAEKLTQSTLIPGIVEEDIRRNPLLGMALPVAWTPGKTIKWVKEDVDNNMVGQTAAVGIGGQLSWSSNVKYVEKETFMTRRYVQRLLDNYIPAVYGTINDYEAVVMAEMQKGIFVDINDLLIYGDYTFSNSEEFDGLHAWCAEQAISTTGGLNTDGADAGLNLSKLRKMNTSMKLGVDVWLFPFEIADRLALAYIDGLGGETTGALTARGQLSYISMGINELGKRVMAYDSTSIVPTDYLVQEESDTGDNGTEKRGKDADAGTSDPTFSIFGIRFGNIYQGVPGFMYGFGDTAMAGQLYRTVLFEQLEDYDAKGIRFVSYGTTLMGSKFGACRMYDVDDDDLIIST